jgi:parallel beta-helix repeat protein
MLQANVRVVEEQLAHLRNRLRPADRSLGEPQVLLLPSLASGQSQQSELHRLLWQQFTLEVKTRAGVETEHVRYILEKLLDRSFERMNAGSLDEQKVVSVLLNQQVALTGAMGEIRKLARSEGKEREQQVEKLVKQFRAAQQGQKVELGGSVRIFSFATSGHVAEEHTQGQAASDEQLQKQLHRLLDQLQEHFEGKVPVLPALRLDQDSLAQSRKQLEGEIKSSQFTTAWITHRWPELRLTVPRVSDNLADLIKEAAEGEELVLAAQQYVLEKGIVVDKSLIIRGAGADKTVIVVKGGEYGLKFRGNCRWELHGVSVEYVGSGAAHGVVADSGVIRIENCRFSGAKWNQQAQQGGDGVWLTGTVRAQMSKCICKDNELCGIRVSDQAQVTLEGNTCEGNKWSGIAFGDKSGGTARNNTCSKNEQNGIYAGGESQPVLEGNTCEGNKWPGIAFGDKSGGTARNNTCSRNEGHGIYAGGESQPVLEGNTCEGNKGCGIAFFDKSGGTARNNTCSKNEKHGIYAGGESQPVLEGNTCEGNKECGIAFFDKSGGTARNNTCGKNEKHGIYAEGESQPVLEGNRCEGNKGSGIAFVGKSGGTARNNTCSKNEQRGILVFGESQPVVEGNTCEGNKWSGIAFVGKSGGTARNNICGKNEKHGIYAEGQSQPVLEGNRCEGNKWSGVAFFGKSGGTARNNTCSRNEQHGILVFGQSQPVLEGNTCEGNKWPGIAFGDKSGGTARKNICRNNGGRDIYVANTAKPKIED